MSYPTLPMRWTESVDIDILKILSRHASGVIGAMAVFMVIDLLAEWWLPDGTLKTVLKTIDGFVLVGLFLWLAYQMGHLLWLRRVRNGPAICILVA